MSPTGNKKGGLCNSDNEYTGNERSILNIKTAVDLLPSGSEQHEVLLLGSILEGIFQARH